MIYYRVKDEWYETDVSPTIIYKRDNYKWWRNNNGKWRQVMMIREYALEEISEEEAILEIL